VVLLVDVVQLFLETVSLKPLLTVLSDFATQLLNLPL
jgi:hypothetical protein